MDVHSDIAGLFSKLRFDSKQYQEISSQRRLEASSSRWALLNEIQGSMLSVRATPKAKDKKLPR